MKNYDESKVVRILSRKKGIRIDTVGKTIKIEKGSDDIGSGSWGKIDYLVSVHGYSQVFTDRKDRPKEEKETKARRSKRDKVNMAEMSRNAMQGVRRGRQGMRNAG